MLSSYKLDTAITLLNIINHSVYTVERMTQRKKTPGRQEEIDNLHSLDCWDATALRTSGEVGINISEISSKAIDYIDNLLKSWR